MRSAVEIVILASAVVAALAALGIAGRKLWQWLKRAGRDLGVLRDTLVGSEPLTNPVTGAELLPEKPGLALRLDRMETNQALLTEAVASLASTERRIDIVETDMVNNRAQALSEHSELRAQALVEHAELDRRIAALEDARVERTVARAESAAMWTAIAADRTADGPAADAQPLDNPDD